METVTSPEASQCCRGQADETSANRCLTRWNKPSLLALLQVWKFQLRPGNQIQTVTLRMTQQLFHFCRVRDTFCLLKLQRATHVRCSMPSLVRAHPHSSEAAAPSVRSIDSVGVSTDRLYCSAQGIKRSQKSEELIK